MSETTDLENLLEAELIDYMSDEPGWVQQAARQVAEAVRLAGWGPMRDGLIPAEEEPEGAR